MSLPTRRLALVAGAGLAATLALAATPAAAHVSPDRSEVPAGGYTDVQLLVPHGCEDQATQVVEVQVPASITSASAYRVAGWTASSTMEELEEPIDDGHGGQLTERVAVLTWTADAGEELPTDQREVFGVGFKAPETVGEQLYFKTIQTCPDGTAEWITEWDGEGEEPDRPAPMVTVVAAEADGHGGGSPDAGAEAPAADVAADPSTRADDAQDASGTSPMSWAALVAGLGGLGLGGAAFVRGRAS